MRIKSILLAIIILLSHAGCGEPEKKEISSSQTIGDFTVTIYADNKYYKKNEEIKLWATLEYTGDKEAVTIGHGDPLLNFYIKSKTDDFVYEIATAATLTYTTIKKNEKYETQFIKPTNMSDEDLETIEDEKLKKFLRNPKVSLPKGIYQVSVMTRFTTSKDSTDRMELAASLDIEVTK